MQEIEEPGRLAWWPSAAAVQAEAANHREEDYAYAQPSLTRKKLRRLELTAGAARGKAEPGIWSANKAMREAERELARQGEVAYKRPVTDWQRAEKSKGAGVTTGRASNRPSEGKAARQTNSP